MMEDKIRLIKEKRTIEAMKKKLVGPAGRIGCIIKYLGTEIKEQGGSFGRFDNYLEDVDDYLNDEEDILTGEDEEVVTIGYIFDGLSSGMQIEMRYLDETNELLVKYKDQIVYREIAGDIRAYNPFPEWESIIDKLTPRAEKKRDTVKETKKAEHRKKGLEAKNKFIKDLKDTWGI